MQTNLKFPFINVFSRQNQIINFVEWKQRRVYKNAY